MLSFGILTSTSVAAQTSLDYYKKVFKLWGIQVDTLAPELTQPATATGGNAQQPTDRTDTNRGQAMDGRYLLVLASQSKNILQAENATLGYQNVIVICDAGEQVASVFGVSCTFDKLNYAEQNPNLSSVADTIKQTAWSTNVNGVNYHVLPQVLLITPQYQESLGFYYKALARSQETAGAKPTKVTGNSIAQNLLSTFKDSALFKGTVYILVLLVFGAVLRQPLAVLFHQPRLLLHRELYLQLAQRAAVLVTYNYTKLTVIFLVLALCYIPVFYTLTSLAGLPSDSGYPLSYIAATLNPFDTQAFGAAQTLFRVGLQFYLYTLALFGFLVILPHLARVVTSASQRIVHVQLNPSFVKWLIPSTVLVNGLALTFGDLQTSAGLVLLSAVVLVTVLVYIQSRHIDYAGLFTATQRRLTMFGLLAGLTLTTAYPMLQQTRPTDYAFEPLIGIKDEVIVFPYSKKWGSQVLFEPYYYTGPSRVYADSYLIYAPNTNRVVNKPLTRFSDAGNITLISENPDAVFETILKTPKLEKYLSTTDFSPLATVDFAPTATVSSPTAQAQLSVNCNLSPPPAAIKLTTVVLDRFAHTYGTTTEANALIDPVITESERIMNFPGCRAETGVETFEIPLDPHTLPQDYAVLLVSGLDPQYLAGFKLVVGRTELPLKYLTKEVLTTAKYTVLYTSPSTSDTLTNYSTQVRTDFQVELTDDSRGYDLSAPINALLKMGVLSNPFSIWTDTPNELLQKL
jgi:hypothetical protein